MLMLAILAGGLSRLGDVNALIFHGIFNAFCGGRSLMESHNDEGPAV
jgi:hypothetical protein